MLICNMCASKESTVCVDGPGTWHCYDPLRGAPFPFKVAVCDKCGHVFGAWEDDRAHLYEDEEYVTCDTDLEQYTTYVMFVLAGITPRNRRLRVLEIGFNRGSLLKRFYDLGFECHGVEPGRLNVEAAQDRMPKARLDNGMFTADWAERYDPGYFDVVMLTSVFEHMTEPAEVLRAIRPYVADRGRLFIVVPDLCAYTPTMQINREEQALYGCSQLKFFYRNLFLCFAQHVNHFSPPSLTRYLSAVGFETRQMATLGYLWVSAAPADPVDDSFDYPDLAAFHINVMNHYERVLGDLRDAVLRRLAGRSVVCYGAGREFGYFLDVFGPLGVEVLAVADDTCAMETIRDVPVVAPDRLGAFNPDVCIATSFDFENEIAARARDLLPESTETLTLTSLLSSHKFAIPSWVDFSPQPTVSAAAKMMATV